MKFESRDPSNSAHLALVNKVTITIVMIMAILL